MDVSYRAEVLCVLLKSVSNTFLILGNMFSLLWGEEGRSVWDLEH